MNHKVVLGCASATELADSANRSVDFVITDPPFGDNLFYSDLANFFFAWLRIPLRGEYPPLFTPTQTPNAQEALKPRALPEDEGDQYYYDRLTPCWAEAHRVLKDGGLLAFTFHHSEDSQWEIVLRSLFDAGFILQQTFPIASDEMKGEAGSFGAKGTEYDMIHVCRKRLEDPSPVSWAKMRRWVKDEMIRLRNLLELYRKELLPEADIRVILRGKALEFYSRHYGQVFKGTEEPLTVREALLGINQLLDDDQMPQRKRPPEDAEPLSRLMLQVYCERSEIARDELHKLLRGTGVTQKDFEDREWVREHAKVIYQVAIPERFEQLRKPGRRRDTIKIDLDQAHFLIGAAVSGSGINIMDDLNKGAMKLKPAVLPILNWLAEMELDGDLRKAAHRAAKLVERWRAEQAAKPKERTLFDLDG